MVGDLLTVECRVDTVPGVSSSSVMINWTAPGGVESIVSDSRLTISPTTSNGNVFTSNLQFTYLTEGDNGSYTCNWMILQSSGSETVELQLTSKFLFPTWTTVMFYCISLIDEFDEWLVIWQTFFLLTFPLNVSPMKSTINVSNFCLSKFCACPICHNFPYQTFALYSISVLG